MYPPPPTLDWKHGHIDQQLNCEYDSGSRNRSFVLSKEGWGGFFSTRKSNLVISRMQQRLRSPWMFCCQNVPTRPTWPSRRSLLNYTRSPRPPSSLTRPGSDITSLNAFCKPGWRQRSGQGLLNYWEFGLPVSIISLPSSGQSHKKAREPTTRQRQNNENRMRTEPEWRDGLQWFHD